MSREKTNSITHLVKIVAREEIETRIHEIKAVHTCNHGDLSARIDELGTKFMGEIRTSLEKAGGTWLQEEDDLLVQEVRTALAQIAKNHQRSMISIRSRINYKELI